MAFSGQTPRFARLEGLDIQFSPARLVGHESQPASVRIMLTLAEDLRSYTSVAERVVMDTSGKELQVTPDIAGRSVRMDVEFPKNPPPQ